MRTMRVTVNVQKRCPYKDELDDSTATLTFDVSAGDGPELHDLAANLDSFRDIALSHEAFTALLAGTPGCVAASSTWRTAGMEVTVDVPSEPE